MLLGGSLPSGASAVSPATAAPGVAGPLRCELEIGVLLSFFPRALLVLLLPCLLAVAARRQPLDRERIQYPRPCMAWPRFKTPELQRASVAALRALLVSEFELGLSLTQTPLDWLSRPIRNFWLAMRAARIGQVAWELASRPDAAPLTDELSQALTALQSAV